MVRRFLAILVTLVAIVFAVRPAVACGNAVLGEETPFKRLHEAEDALDEGDLKLARELATPIANGAIPMPVAADAARARAHHIIAMSYVRDRQATQEQIAGAIATLEDELRKQDGAKPSLEADAGEALARSGRDDEAFAKLSSLANADLMGSPYAYAALARIAKKRGDAGMATLAAMRCANMTTNAAVCRGEYPPQPLLRGKLLGYVLPGVLAMIALVRRRRRKRPWSSYGDKVYAAIVVATCALVFVYARAPATTTVMTFAALALVGLSQRLVFLSAVKRHRIPAFVLREATTGDSRLPSVASFFHPRERVLEHVPDASYREPARMAVLRLTPRRRGALALAVVGVLTLALFGSCATLTMRSTKSESASSRLYAD